MQKLETGERYIMIRGLEVGANKANAKIHHIELTARNYLLLIE